jgi:general bacterial porin, GBP family
MRTRITALLIAGLASGGAFAQSNVTVYGSLDIGYFHQNFDDGRKSDGIDSHGLKRSVLGFKGVEDLGNNMKATFDLTYHLANDQNTGIGTTSAPYNGTVAAEQTIGLMGDFGTIKAGRLNAAGVQFSCSTDPLAATAFDALGKLSLATGSAGARSMLVCGNTARMNNGVGYWSPKFGGFGVIYAYSRAPFGSEIPDTPGGTSDNVVHELAGTYNNGPLYLMAIGVRQSRDDITTLIPAEIKEYGVGGTYDFGVVKLQATYQTMKAENVRSDAKDKKWQIGAVIPVFTADKLIMTYGAMSLGDVNDTDAKAFGIAYDHALSKRTSLYAGYSQVTNETFSRQGNWNPASASPLLTTPAADADPSIWGFGMYHTF